MNKHPLAHGTIDGPKQDSNSPAKHMADKHRTQEKSKMSPEVKELLQILSEILRMDEMDIGDISQLPEDHPVARAEYLLHTIYKFKAEVHV